MSIHTLLIYLGICFFFSLPTYAQEDAENTDFLFEKTLTSSNGQSKKFRILSYDENQIVVHLNGKDVVIPLEDLSEKDQAFFLNRDLKQDQSEMRMNRILSHMSERFTHEDRLKCLTKGGGKPIYDEKIILALTWMKKTQNIDGSWKAQGKPVGMTGLALLAYLGHGETPASPDFGLAVENAIIYLIKVGEKNRGKLATSTTSKTWCYEHAIATYALAEAYIICKAHKISIPKLKETVTTAGLHIIDSQHDSGGWDYGYNTDGTRGGDTSITCWHLQALKACKLSKLLDQEILDLSVERGLKYFEGAKNGKGTIGYGTNGNNLSQGPTMTPGAVLCYQQWGRGNRSFTRNGIKWIASNHTFVYKTEANLYMHYFSSQAMINAGGNAWANYNARTMPNLAAAQNEEGSWDIPGGASHGMSSKHYATCLSALMLEVYYRYSPQM